MKIILTIQVAKLEMNLILLSIEEKKKIFKDKVDSVSHETFVKIGTFLQEIFQAKWAVGFNVRV